MKKTVLCIALVFVISLCLGTFCAGAEETHNFSIVKAEYPDGEKYFNTDYQTFQRICARYKDDKTVIPLSAYYDGYINATVPEKYKNREIEGFVQDEITFLDDTGDYEFYSILRLAERGVIYGDGNKNAMPFKAITRAEAVAMTLRLAGIESEFGAESGFSDVAESSWYAEPITAALKCGIVKGESPKIFNPNREASLEEVTTMLYRTLVYVGLLNESDADIETQKAELSETCDNVRDIDSISTWALPAYNAFGNRNIYRTEYDEETPPGQEYSGENYFYPQKIAMRSEAANLLFAASESRQVYPSQAAVKYGFDKQMPIIDGSTSTYPFTEALYSNLFYNGYNVPGKPASHSKSHASYERLINGEVDMLFASVYPAEDIINLAKEKGVELELIPIAYDAMIFFTNKDNTAENLTKEQITNIYVDNAYANWNQLGGPDALLYPYCRNNDSGSHAQMEKHFLNGNQINEKIRNETTSTSMSNVLTDVMDAKTDNPLGYGLGYSIYYYFQNMDPVYDTNLNLKLLSIDGVKPTDESIADGSYPLSNNTYIVLKASEPKNSPARKMAEFMLTDKGQTVVENAGYGPLK